MLKAIFATATLLVSINLRADDKAAVGLPYLPIVDSTDEIFAPTQQVPLLPLAVDTVSDAVSSFPVPSAPLTDDSPEPDEAIPEIDFAAMNTPELFQVYSPAMSGDGCGESCFCPVAADGDRSVTVYGGLLFLGRSRPDSQALFSNQTNPAQQLNGRDFDFGVQTGFEIGGIQRGFLGDLDLDVRYFSTDDVDDFEFESFSGGVVRIHNALPFDLVGPRRVFADYASEMRSVEANLRYRCGGNKDWLTVLAGLRYISLDESLVGLLVDPAAIAANQQMSVAVDNRLFGIQVGMDAMLAGDRQHSIEAYGRAGIYHGDSDTVSRQTTFTTPAVGFGASGSDGQASSVCEIGLQAKCRLAENLDFYGRYQATWINDVALASNQLTATNLMTGSVGPANANVIYHGAVFGLEYAF